MYEQGIDLSVPCKVTGTKTRPMTRISSTKAIITARLVLEEKLGRAIRPEHYALHACDNQLCLESLHIYEGTQGQNVVDTYLGGLRARTHCPQGHEYTDGNTATYKGSRYCKMCKRERSREKRRLAS
jgi:hypothetical protein